MFDHTGRPIGNPTRPSPPTPPPCVTTSASATNIARTTVSRPSRTPKPKPRMGRKSPTPASHPTQTSPNPNRIYILDATNLESIF
jgi:hypothetical protein